MRKRSLRHSHGMTRRLLNLLTALSLLLFVAMAVFFVRA